MAIAVALRRITIPASLLGRRLDAHILQPACLFC